MSLIGTLSRLIPEQYLSVSGSVFYSGLRAFSHPSATYILGLNPGGSPVKQANETIGRHIEEMGQPHRLDWSAYLDESWLSKPPGTHGLQPRMLHLFQTLGLNPRHVPSSNLVFVRSARESNLGKNIHNLAQIFWPFHEYVITSLGVKTVICLGQTCGSIVRSMLEAHELVATFTESNQRRWTSTVHKSPDERFVATLTHPSIAAWGVRETDPTLMVKAFVGS